MTDYLTLFYSNDILAVYNSKLETRLTKWPGQSWSEVLEWVWGFFWCVGGKTGCFGFFVVKVFFFF